MIRKIYLIRHSMTQGNLQKRYIGFTDENLCKEGIQLLEERLTFGKYPECDRIFTSPRKRCIQTAEILYPGRKMTVIEELAECDFGMFENKNYEDLTGVPEYQQWISSGGTLPFPGGESREAFCKRSLTGFEKALGMCKETDENVAFIVHGGTIMSIMEKYAVPKGSYYDFQIGNGEGYELVLSDDRSFDRWIYSGSFAGRSALDVSPGANDWESHYSDRKNYQRLFAENEKR